MKSDSIDFNILHVNSFLSSSYKSLKDLCEDTKKCCSKIDSISKTDIDAADEIREISSDFKDDSNDILEIVEEDYKLFKNEITILIRNKHDEQVIYSGKQFRKYFLEYDELRKKVNALNNRVNRLTDNYYDNKNYIKYMAYRKIKNIINRINDIINTIVEKLESLLDS